MTKYVAMPLWSRGGACDGGAPISGFTIFRRVLIGIFLV